MVPDDDEYAYISDRFNNEYPEDEDTPTRETCCRDCQSTDVYWAETGGKWTLYDFRTSRRHACTAEHVTANRMDAFENLD